jgi:hypothetical protein
MTRLMLWLFIGAYVIMAGPTLLRAQNATYDEGALRLEGHGGDLRIVRGVQGTVVAHIGGFRTPDVSAIVSPSEKAMLEAKSFARDYGPGNWIAAVGIVALGAGIGVSRMHDANRSLPTGLAVSGAALILYGGTRIQSAYNALTRSIWWYNRDLKQ